MLLEAPAVLTVAEVTSADGLEQLHHEWTELFLRCRHTTPFQSPEWLIPWWRHIGEGDLWTLAVREAGELVGVAPLYVYTHPEDGRREVFPIGIATTDYLDVLFLPEHAERGMRAVFEHLRANAHRWDACEFPQLRPESPLLSAPAPSGWYDEISGAECCPVLALPRTEADLRSCVPARMLHNLRYYQRRAEKLGRVRFERAHDENLDELFDALLRLHGARWSSKGEAGVLCDERVRQAHRESLPGLLARGMLRLYALRLGERIVAVYYGFADPRHGARRHYYYLGGFEPELAELSLGTLLIGHAIRQAVREGAVEFDFLRGQEPYKYLWGAMDRPTFRRHLRH